MWLVFWFLVRTLEEFFPGTEKDNYKFSNGIGITSSKKEVETDQLTPQINREIYKIR